ncbi:MAG: xanthine dehydrogenase small subunit, partial [Pseudomonadota bacterium]
GDRVVYRAVNACILFLPMLDGKELITVESLARGGALHPIQHAMVEEHGSQCGFCTPGIVMALFARHLRADPAGTEDVADTLAGNLCRCTGYGPIIRAAHKADAAPKPSEGDAHYYGGRETVEALRGIQRRETLELDYTDPLSGRSARFFAPVDTAELARLAAAHPGATFLAGATDVGLWVTKQHRHLPVIISINDVEEMRGVDDLGDRLRIGAGVRYTDAMEAIGALYPDFGEMLRRLGSVQVRNSGTMGGNVANGSPIGDSMPALIAAGAEVTLRSEAGARTLPMEEYFIAYGKQDRAPTEFVESVTLAKPTETRRYAVYKLSKRFDQDISAVCGGFSVELDGDRIVSARVAFGGMAATPKRAPACEAAMTGAALSGDWAEAAAKALETDYAPISDMRASSDYRLRSAKNMVRRFALETAAAAGSGAAQPARIPLGKELAHA